MSGFIEAGSGLAVPERLIGEVAMALNNGDFSKIESMESLVHIERMLEDLMDRHISNMQYDSANIIGLQGPNRQQILRILRRLRHSNPLAKHSSKLVGRYTFGAGVSWRAKNGEIGALLKRFWEDNDNRLEITSHQAMVERCDDIWTDGDLFLGLWSGDDGRVKVRAIPPEEIQDVITSPQDKRKALYYKRVRTPMQYDFAAHAYTPVPTGAAPEITYIPAWNNYNVERDKTTLFAKNPKGLVDNFRIYHVAINKVGKFGMSELWTIRDWVRSYVQFIEDRITINRAAASIAWQKKVKGGSGKDISEAVRRGIAGRTVNLGDGLDFTLPPVAGSTAVTGDNVEYKWTRGDTGASGAVEDGRSILMIVGAGVDLPIHWFGEGGDANLATAKAMNFPVFRMFLEWQMLWAGIFSFLFNYAIWRAVETGQISGASFEDIKGPDGGIADREYILPESISPFVDIDFPPLAQEDMATMVQAIIQSATTFAKTTEAIKDYASAALTALGFNNVDELISRHFPEGEDFSIEPEPKTPEQVAAESLERATTRARQTLESLSSSYPRNNNGMFIG